MPWYWSDDLATTLLKSGSIDSEGAALLAAIPIAYRRSEDSVEDAAAGLTEEGEIPLAA